MQLSAPLAWLAGPPRSAGEFIDRQPDIHHDRTPMKMITAVVGPSRLDAILDALEGIGVGGVTVTETSATHGEGDAHNEVYRGATYAMRLTPRLRLEIAAEDDAVARIVDVIAGAALTDHPADGLILVSDLDGCLRIRRSDRPL